MIRINLIRRERKREKKAAAVQFTPNELTKQLSYVALILVTIGIAAFFWFDLQGRKDVMQRDVGAATRERDRLKTVKELVDRLEGERGRLAQRLEVLSNLKNNLRTPLYNLFFVYLAQQEHRNVTIFEVTEVDAGAALTINGEATQENLNKFSDTLMKDLIVRNIDIISQVGERFQIRVNFVPVKSLSAPAEDPGVVDGGEAAGGVE